MIIKNAGMKSKMLIYKTDDITVRKIKKTDELLMVVWLTDPRLLEYYEDRDRPHDIDMVRDHLYIIDDEVWYIFEYCGKLIGYIQYYQLDEESRQEYRLRKVKLLKEHEKHEGIYRDYWLIKYSSI